MKTALFVPCLIDQFQPSIAEDTVRILKRLGVSVRVFSEQTCCGQPLLKSGYQSKTRKLAKNVIRIFEGAKHVVIPSGSCVAMIKKEYPELLREEGMWLERAKDLATRVHELTEFPVHILKIDDVGAFYPEKVTFHDSCQVSRALGILEEPRKLIQKVRGLELVEMDQSDLCCGFGGTFSIKYPMISQAMLEEKVKRITATEVKTVVSCEPSCLIHIDGYLRHRGIPLKTLHIAELLNNRRS